VGRTPPSRNALSTLTIAAMGALSSPADRA
jgi:hypothetical protein